MRKVCASAVTMFLLVIGCAAKAAAAPVGIIDFDADPFGGNVSVGTVAGTCPTTQAGFTCAISKQFADDATGSLTFLVDVFDGGDYFFEELVTNNTTQPWAGYHIVVSCGDSGCGPYAFTSFTDKGSFSSAVLTPGNSEAFADLSGGILGIGDSMTLKFSIDSNAHLMIIFENPDPAAATTVPEPASLLLVTTGLAACAWRARALLAAPKAFRDQDVW